MAFVCRDLAHAHQGDLNQQRGSPAAGTLDLQPAAKRRNAIGEAE
jgi:hypothetical protein